MLSQAAVSLVWLASAAGKAMEVGAVGGASGDVGLVVEVVGMGGGRGRSRGEPLRCLVFIQYRCYGRGCGFTD